MKPMRTVDNHASYQNSGYVMEILLSTDVVTINGSREYLSDILRYDQKCANSNAIDSYSFSDLMKTSEIAKVIRGYEYNV